jgi:AraC family transcriptional regulator, positive regulator of tynA and feaB
MRAISATPTVLKTHADEFASRLRSICGDFAVSPANSDETITGSISLQRRGHLDIAEVESDSDCIVRNDNCIRLDPGEHFFFILQKSGQADMSQGHSHVTLEPGSAILIDSMLPCEFHYGGRSSRQISFHLPRAEFFQRFGAVAPAGLIVKRETAIANAMQLVVAELLSEAGSQKLAFLSEAFLNILGARIAEDVRNAENIEYRITLRARQLIDMRFRDPGLSASNVAEQLGISLRRLQRLFEETGENVSQLIKDRRLECARRQLIACARGARRDLVSTIAYEAGFNDLSYFNKVFRRAYGTTPSQISRDSGAPSPCSVNLTRSPKTDL